MDEQEYFITFDTVSAATANRYAEELKETLLDSVPKIKVERRRDDPRAQDFGATLVLILGAPSVVSLVSVLGVWLQKRRDASISIEDGKKKITIKNISAKDAVRLGELSIPQK